MAAMAVCGTAWAESYTYEGQIQFHLSPKDPCASAYSDASYAIRIDGRDDSPSARIEGYLDGGKMVIAHFGGNNLGSLALAFPGEPKPSHTLRLRSAGNGAFTGELETKSLIAVLVGCGYAKATISFAKTATHTPEAFQQAAQLFDADSRAVLAYVQAQHGQIKEGLPIVEQALAFEEKVLPAGDPRLLTYYYFLGQLHLVEGSFPDMVPLDRKAAAICEQAYGTESVCEGMVLTSLGQALELTGSYVEAEASLRRAQDICNRYCDPNAAFGATLLGSLGDVYLDTGRYAEAEAALLQAAALDKKVHGPSSSQLGITLNDLGVLYRLMGQYGKAESSLRQAVAMDEKVLGADSGLVMLNQVALAGILHIQGKDAEAEPLARSALASAEKVLGPERSDHPVVNGALLVLAEILRESGRYAEAEPLYRQALANSEKFLGPDHPQVAGLSMKLAQLLRATGRDAEALALLKRAYRITRISDNQTIGWRVPGELMQYYRAGKSPRPMVAIFYGKEAVNKLQTLRGNLSGSGKDAQQSFVSAAEVNSVYRTLADLLIAQGRLSEAQQVLAMIKEQEFYNFTQRAAAVDAPKTVASLNAPEKELDALNAREIGIGKEYGALQDKMRRDGKLSAADRKRLEALRAQIDEAQASFDTKAAAVAKSSADPEARKRRGEEINDFSRAFQGTLRDMGHDAVLAQYFIEDDRVAILLTTPTAVVARESLIKRQDLVDQIRAYRKTLASPSQDPLPQAQALYRVLIGPIAADLHAAGAKTLMLSLDDMLRYLPFAALHDGSGYLVENMSIVMVTEAVRDKLARQPKPDWSVWGMGVTKGGKDYEALPYVGEELNGITGAKGILAGRVMLDKEFTENSLRDGLDLAYPIIHIASHFQFTSGSMDDSFLLLGDGSRMTLAQIKTKLNFNGVELLTLSACETAVGDANASYTGVEVEGLGALAQQAGAKAVLATLWPVADGSTALLMRVLYRAHKQDHLDKAEALRAAQLALLKGTVQADASIKATRGLARMGTPQAGGSFKPDPNAPFAHPFYWAPFILMGNWL
jgi:CHAT domain-containing protein